ncbi:MAG TPA: hypothetical protein VGA07_00075 [Anaerolineales bacterium]
MTGFYDVMDFFAYTLRFFGALAFGVGAGWLAMHLLKGQHANWQLSAAIFLGLLAAFVLIGHWVSGAAALGGFGLGAGGGVLAWGLGVQPAAPSRGSRSGQRRTPPR